MAQIDYRKIPVRELYLYMNLVMGVLLRYASPAKRDESDRRGD